MKSFTIKALILSLLILSAPNTRCYSLGYGIFLGTSCAAGVAIGAAVTGIVGSIICVGCKVVKDVFSSENQKDREERRKKRATKKAKRKRKKAAKRSSKKPLGEKTRYARRASACYIKV